LFRVLGDQGKGETASGERRAGEAIRTFNSCLEAICAAQVGGAASAAFRRRRDNRLESLKKQLSRR
jgi:hypothetical protein